eukprot:1010568-Prymnesium_polylepis.1
MVNPCGRLRSSLNDAERRWTRPPPSSLVTPALGGGPTLCWTLCAVAPPVRRAVAVVALGIA